MSGAILEERVTHQENIIRTLRPWKDGPIWVFDDDDCGLKREAFVPSASELIDALIKKYRVKPDKEGKITLLFSHVPFPKSTKLVLVGTDGPGLGVTFKWKERDIEAWLCPAFFFYFGENNVPQELYALAA